MLMEFNESIKLKINKIQDINNPDLLRYELYAILTTLILSKEEFKQNKDINEFLIYLHINFKGYILKTRTLIMAKTLRIVEKADNDNLENYKKAIVNLYLSDKVTSDLKVKGKDESKENYMNNILNKYSRNKE